MSPGGTGTPPTALTAAVWAQAEAAPRVCAARRAAAGQPTPRSGRSADHHRGMRNAYAVDRHRAPEEIIPLSAVMSLAPIAITTRWRIGEHRDLTADAFRGGTDD